MKKALRILGVVILIIILIPFIVALFVGKTYEVNKEIVVSMPREVAYDYVVMLKNQDVYNGMGEIYPEMRVDYKGTDGTVGFVYAWENKCRSIRKGEQKITGVIPGERIDYEVRLFRPFMVVSSMWITFEDELPGSVKIIWGMKCRVPYPMNALILLMGLEHSLGNDIEAGLIKLKKVLEADNR